MDTDMILYVMKESAPCRLVLLIHDFLNLNFEIKQINLEKGEHKEKWFLEINPRHCVPTLFNKKNGFTMTESRAIAKYLLDNYQTNKENLNMYKKAEKIALQRIMAETCAKFYKLKLDNETETLNGTFHPEFIKRYKDLKNMSNIYESDESDNSDTDSFDVDSCNESEIYLNDDTEDNSTSESEDYSDDTDESKSLSYPGLYEKDQIVIAKIMELLYYDLGTLYKRIGDYIYGPLFHGEKLNKDKKELVRKSLFFLENLLNENDYLVCNNLTLADLSICLSCTMLEFDKNFEYGEFQKFVEWRNKIKNFPNWTKINKSFYKWVERTNIMNIS